MQQRKFRVPQRKTQRRWRVPPALRRGDESFEGLSVLEEVRGDEAIVLWQSLRDALLWADARPEERGELFAPAAERARMEMIEAAAPAPGLREPLASIARMLAEPGATPEETVSLACSRVARWADEQGLLATALAFAQAAATVTPGDAGAAFAVGKLARRRAEYPRAETWLRRSIALARQAGDWATYAHAFLSLGRMNLQRGNLPVARRLLVRSVRAAQRNSLHEVQGMALHDLFGVAVQAGRTEEARDLARAAFEAYGPRHRDLPRLAQDVAYWWITQGEFARALPVLRSTLQHLPAPADQLIVRSNVARVLGALGDREGFRAAWDECYELIHSAGVDERAPQGLLDLAHGAASLSLWDRAESAARQALEIGARRQEAQIHLTAEALIDSVRHHRVLDTRKRAPQPPEGSAADTRFASELVRSLQR